MMKAAAERGWVDERGIFMESHLSMRRAGADMIITYAARNLANWLKLGACGVSERGGGLFAAFPHFQDGHNDGADDRDAEDDADHHEYHGDFVVLLGKRILVKFDGLGSTLLELVELDTPGDLASLIELLLAGDALAFEFEVD